MRKGSHHSQESREKMSNTHTGMPNNWLGRKHKPESIAKYKESRKKYRHSDETKQKISESLTGRTVPEEIRKKISEGKKGDKNPTKRPEVAAKISRAKIGKPLSPESIRKRSDTIITNGILDLNTKKWTTS